MKKTLYRIIDKIIKWHEYMRCEEIRKKYKLPKDFGFNGKHIKFHGKGSLIIGKKSYMGNYTFFQLEEGCKIIIGEGCSISHNVRIYTSSKIPDYDFKYKKDVPSKTGDVIIGDYSWIGANVFINPGITIGKNCVIGANSVVTNDTLENGIYGGVPAKLIRMKKFTS